MKIFKPKDWMAGIIIVGYIFLSWKGLETTLTTATMIIIGYYFAKRENGEDNGY